MGVPRAFVTVPAMLPVATNTATPGPPSTGVAVSSGFGGVGMAVLVVAPAF